MNLESTIYKSVHTVFVPSDKLVESAYAGGNAGDQLWLQIYAGRVTGNYWSKKEILALNPETIDY